MGQQPHAALVHKAAHDPAFLILGGGDSVSLQAPLLWQKPEGSTPRQSIQRGLF